MDYWAVIFLCSAVLCGLFGAQSITNSVSLISWCLAIAFFCAFVGSLVYVAIVEKGEPSHE